MEYKVINMQSSWLFQLIIVIPELLFVMLVVSKYVYMYMYINVYKSIMYILFSKDR